MDHTSRQAAAPGPARVVVIEDNAEIADIVATALRYDGHDVAVAGTGADGLAQVARGGVDLVLLDVMLPDTDGFAVQRELVAALARAGGRGPAVMFLTARDDSVDVVRALNLGAEDYVRKPFVVDELLARVNATLRRSRSATAGAHAPGTAADGGGGADVLRVADLELDPRSRDVRRAGALVELTPREFDLLVYLMRNTGIVLTKAQLLDEVWKYDFGGDGNVVETYVGYLRKKVDRVEPKLIHTVRGVGYCLRERPGGA